MAHGKSIPNSLLKIEFIKALVFNSLQSNKKRGLKPPVVLSFAVKPHLFLPSRPSSAPSASTIPIILHLQSIHFSRFYTILPTNTLHIRQPNGDSGQPLPHPLHHASVSVKRTRHCKSVSLPTTFVSPHSSSYAPTCPPLSSTQKNI